MCSNGYWKIKQDNEESEIAVFIENTLIKDVRYFLVLIEYPATSDKVITYMYHVKNWTNPKAVFHNVQIIKTIKYCGGIKACKLAGLDILEASHSDIDLKTDPFICKNNFNTISSNILTRELTQM
ncbi:13061_t:CDS:2 [Funneliformis caledonium]|uniref:13061_t:CDS:1 n=1 Tax=Funneliformis caledonium TaxID=1117310 RepID=A0A9N9AKU2_9GLOM|nr:13061_t:CDS:2 [Funneliformis caledonium]